MSNMPPGIFEKLPSSEAQKIEDALAIPDFLKVENRKSTKKLVYSYSLLNNYANVCPHQTWRRYIKKDQPFVETPAMKYGNDAHTALELRLGGKPLPPEMQQWEPIVSVLAERKGIAEQKLGITRTAKPCGFFDDGVWFRGKIDVTLMEGSTACIVDYKTGRSDREDPFELETNALLLHAKHPHLRQIKGFYVWLKENRVGQPYDLDTNGAWHKVCELTDQFEADREFEKKKSGLCGYCSVKDCEHHYVARLAAEVPK